MKFIHTSLALILCIVMSASFAARLPSHYPENFQYIGLINRINIDQGTAIISGRQFTLSSNLVVHTTMKQFDEKKKLGEGQAVGLSYLQSGEDNRIATEIWILPGDYHLEQR